MKAHDARAEPAQRQPAAAARHADEQSPAEGAGLQADIDCSPRVLAQRREIDAAFGRALEDEQPSQVSVAPVNQTGMPDQLKVGIESLSGMSLDHVRVHYNSDRPAQLSALAYAQGNEIHLAPQQEAHLPHEAWHVVQQAKGGVRPTVDIAGVPVNDDRALEAEADRMGAQALALGRGGVSLADGGMAGDRGLSPAPAQLHARRGVVQRSSAGVDAGDEDAARLALQRGMDLIAQATQGQVPEADPVGFSNVATTHQGPVAPERKSIAVLLDRRLGQGWEQIYITPSERAGLHLAAEQNHWNFRYSFGNVEYLGQYAQQAVGTSTPVQMAAVVTGALNPNAAKVGVVNPNLANATITYLGVNAQNVTTGMNATSLHRQPMGTAVGNTRPNQWATFLAMAGALNPFKQGHHLSQELSGDGSHDNLAPFTASLNALHCTRVENYVINQTDNPPRDDEFADYSVVPSYAGNAGIAAWAITQFNNMPVATRLAAMVNAGVIAPATAAGILAGLAPALSGAQTALAHNWITTYVTATFPTDITCSVTFIDYDATNVQYEAAAAQVVNITNDF